MVRARHLLILGALGPSGPKWGALVGHLSHFLNSSKCMIIIAFIFSTVEDISMIEKVT